MTRRHVLAALGASAGFAACGGGSADDDDAQDGRSGPGRWRALGVGLAASFHGTAVAADGAVVVIGGSRGEPTLSAAVDRLDPATGQWLRLGQMTTGRGAMGVARLPDGRVLVAGGNTASNAWPTAELIDPVRGTLTAAGALVRPRHRHALVALADGRALVVGGVERDSVEIWDPDTRSWRLVAQRMAHGREYPTATLLDNGRVLIAGGATAAATPVFAEVFDPRDERFTPVPGDIAEQRIFHAAHRLADGSVAVLGGERADGAQEPMAAVWRFDPVRGRFNAAPALQMPRTLAASAAFDGGVMLVGGEDAAGLATTPWTWSATAGQRALAPLPAARTWHRAERLADGRVVVIGGEIDGRYVSDVLVHERT